MCRHERWRCRGQSPPPRVHTLSNLVTWKNRGTRGQRKLSSLTNEQDVRTAQTHTHSLSHLVIVSSSCCLLLTQLFSLFFHGVKVFSGLTLLFLSSMEAVALFSFTASDAAEISFQKGDIIKVCGCVSVYVCVGQQ